MKRHVEVMIATEDGPLQLEAELVVGIWAAVFYRGQWSVTHLPSGRSILRTETRLEAEGTAVRLSKRFPSFRRDEPFSFEKKVTLSRQGEDLEIARFLGVSR